MRYGNIVNPTTTPQTQPIPGKNMVPNAAGGYGFATSDWQQLDRFLVLGTEGGTYYIKEDKLTLQNAATVIKLIQADGVKVVERAVEISIAGRAIKNDSAIFTIALAIKYGNDATRQAAYASIPKVCRIGTHLFMLAQALDDLGKGWGRGLKKAVSNWYLGRTADEAAFQMAKYQQRNGWSNADLLRLSHPKTTDKGMNAAFKWAVDGVVGTEVPNIIKGLEQAKNATKDEVLGLIKEYGLPRECIPTQYLNEADVWGALLDKMPLTAMVRNLGNMTKSGLLTSVSDATQVIVSRLQDKDYVRKSKVHPISILLALKTYSSGAGFRGGNTWTPVQKIVSALDKAFYLAFDNVEATGKNFFLGIDVSGSMGMRMNDSNLTHCEAGAAMAMTIMKTEPKYWAYGFCHELVDLGIHDGMSLDSVAKAAIKNNFGSTNCAVAIEYALKNKLDVDVFVIITDNETYAGPCHATQVLTKYRKQMNKPNAKLMVLATAGNTYSIADPSDSNQLDVAGFDASVPQILSEFVKLN